MSEGLRLRRCDLRRQAGTPPGCRAEFVHMHLLRLDSQRGRPTLLRFTRKQPQQVGEGTGTYQG